MVFCDSGDIPVVHAYCDKMLEECHILLLFTELDSPRKIVQTEYDSLQCLQKRSYLLLNINNAFEERTLLADDECLDEIVACALVEEVEERRGHVVCDERDHSVDVICAERGIDVEDAVEIADKTIGIRCSDCTDNLRDIEDKRDTLGKRRRRR